MSQKKYCEILKLNFSWTLNSIKRKQGKQIMTAKIGRKNRNIFK